MTIPVNARTLMWKAEGLKQNLDQLWKLARETRQNLSAQNIPAYQVRTRATLKNIGKLLTDITIAELKVPFQAVYGWTDAEWLLFRSSAASVVQTLAPAALAVIETNEKALMPGSFDKLSGNVVWPAIPSQAQTDITAALQAVESAFTTAAIPGA